MTIKRTAGAAAIGALLTACLLTGCSSSQGSGGVTKQDEANFKGGPMPAEAAEAMKKANEAQRNQAVPAPK